MICPSDFSPSKPNFCISRIFEYGSRCIRSRMYHKSSSSVPVMSLVDRKDVLMMKTFLLLLIFHSGTNSLRLPLTCFQYKKITSSGSSCLFASLLWSISDLIFLHFISISVSLVKSHSNHSVEIKTVSIELIWYYYSWTLSTIQTTPNQASVPPEVTIYE